MLYLSFSFPGRVYHTFLKFSLFSSRIFSTKFFRLIIKPFKDHCLCVQRSLCCLLLIQQFLQGGEIIKKPALIFSKQASFYVIRLQMYPSPLSFLFPSFHKGSNKAQWMQGKRFRESYIRIDSPLLESQNRANKGQSRDRHPER